jgi:hypothetical protein
MQSYIYWALLGMVGYSLTTLFTKLAERSGEVSSYMVPQFRASLFLSLSLLSSASAVSLSRSSTTWKRARSPGHKIVGLAAAVIGVVLISF